MLVNVSTSFREHAACHQFVLALLLEDSPYQAVVAVTQRAAVALTQRAHTRGEWAGRKSPPYDQLGLERTRPELVGGEKRAVELSRPTTNLVSGGARLLESNFLSCLDTDIGL